MRSCPFCGAVNDDSNRYCWQCGQQLIQNVPPNPHIPEDHTSRRMPGRNIGALITAALAIILLILLLTTNFPLSLFSLAHSPPEPLSPAVGETVDNHYPIFEWSDEGAKMYHLRVMDEDRHYVINETIDSCTYQSPVYFENGIYKWTVRGLFEDMLFGDTWTEWSKESVFFVGTDTINRHYEWEFKGRIWTWDMMIPAENYTYYHQQERTYDYTAYVTDDDPVVESLAEELKSFADERGWTQYDLVSFTLAFVQSLEYTSDSVTTGYDEYPRYPLETLVDMRGDCEDTSILFASLIQADPINIDAVLLLLPADSPVHMAAGVAGTGIPGYYYTFEGKHYYYCETTGDGWKIGEIPDDFMGVPAKILQV